MPAAVRSTSPLSGAATDATAVRALQNVAEAFGRDKSDARQIEVDLTEESVGRNRTRMCDERDLVRGNIVQQRAQCVEETDIGRARRRRDLVARQPTRVVESDEIGKRPPYVDADPHAHVIEHAERPSRSSLSAQHRSLDGVDIDRVNAVGGTSHR